MHLLDLPADPRPFALLRRRTPGHDENVVELLLGPVRTYDRLADLPEGARVKASYDLRDGVKVARAISAEKPEPEEPPAVKR